MSDKQSFFEKLAEAFANGAGEGFAENVGKVVAGAFVAVIAVIVGS